MKYDPFPQGSDTWMKEREDTQLVLVQCTIGKKILKHTYTQLVVEIHVRECLLPNSDWRDKLPLQSKTSLKMSETLSIAAAWGKSTRKCQDAKVYTSYISVEPALCAIRTTVVKMWSPDRQHQCYLGTCQKRRISRPYLRLTESEILGMRLRNMSFHKPPGDSEAHLSLGTAGIEA